MSSMMNPIDHLYNLWIYMHITNLYAHHSSKKRIIIYLPTKSILLQHVQLATCYLLLATCYLLLATCYSPKNVTFFLNDLFPLSTILLYHNYFIPTLKMALYILFYDFSLEILPYF